MNKYSKRALKTTATVGMSLAMVLSAAAPVMAAQVLPTTTCVAAGATEVACKELFFDLNKAITAIGLDELTVDSTATIAGTDDVNIIAAIIANKAALLAGSDYSTVRTWTAVTDVIAVDKLDTVLSKGMFSTDYFTTADTDTEKTGGLVNFYNTQLTTGEWKDAEAMKTDAAAAAAVKAFEKMTGWVNNGFYDRLDETLAGRFDEVYEVLEERTADFVVADSEVTRVFIAAWSTVLDADMNGAGTTIKFDKDATTNAKLLAATGLTGEAAKSIDTGSKAALKARIAAIKDAPNYYRVKEDDAVLDIIAQYEDLQGTITDLKDLLKDDSYKAFTSTKVKTNKSADATLKAFLAKVVVTGDNAKEEAQSIGKQMTAELLEVLVALKEDVLDNAYNFETKEVGSYFVDKSDWVTGFSGSTTVKKDMGLASNLMFALVDNKEGLFGIDVIIAQAQEGAAAYAAVTKGIEKLTPANIKASDKKTLEAAEDALYEFEKDGEYVANITVAQTRELRRITTKIDNLREAFDNLGTTAAAGWYDMGNGNWGYNNEDGTAATKWVAAGSNWYYVKGGNMLRNAWVAQDATGAKWYYVDNAGKMVANTTIDGFVIDANGVWTK